MIFQDDQERMGKILDASERYALSPTVFGSAEGEALCRGSGPRIRGMQKRVPFISFLAACGGEEP